MTPETFITVALDPALSLLPAKMDSLEARRMILAICLQESKIRYRRQIVGPARGYPQFEKAGVHGVVWYHATAKEARRVCRSLDITWDVSAIHHAIAYNDVLSVCFARLLLWTLPYELPTTREGAWAQYLEAWRPGKPKLGTWRKHWEKAGYYVGGERR